jgi:hypothetical protein
MLIEFPPNAPAIYVPVLVVGPRGQYTFNCTLDTGSALTVLPALVLRRLGVDLAHPAGRVRLRSATGHAPVPLVSLGAVSALGRVRTQFVVAAHDFPIGVAADGLLGLDFLRGFVLKLDFARGRAALKPPRKWWQFWK